MKLTIPLVAAVFLCSATIAQAGPIATTTDEARAMAGRALPAAGTMTITTPAGPATTTDEARAMAGVAIRAPAPTKAAGKAVACLQACACKHG